MKAHVGVDTRTGITQGFTIGQLLYGEKAFNFVDMGSGEIPFTNHQVSARLYEGRLSSPEEDRWQTGYGFALAQLCTHGPDIGSIGLLRPSFDAVSLFSFNL